MLHNQDHSIRFIIFHTVQWTYPNNWMAEDKPLTEITACSVDPYGQVLIVGGSDGRFALICRQTGLPLPYAQHQLFAEFVVDDRSRIQVISSALMPYNSSHKQYQLMCAMGTASGLLQVHVMCIQRNLEVEQDSPSSLLRLCQMSVLYSGWPHSIGQKPHGIGVRGGTLCLATQEKLTVSGGGDGRCFLMMLYSPTYLCEDTHEDVIEDQGAPITAVTAEQNMIALALSNGNVRVYRSDIFGTTTLLATMDRVSSQPITSLAWGMCDTLDTIHHLFLATGGLDEKIRTYLVRMGGQSVLLEQLTGPGGPIVDLRIRDQFLVAGTKESHVEMWRISSDSARCIKTQSIDISKRSDLADSVINSKRLMCLALYFDGILRPMHRFAETRQDTTEETNNEQPVVYQPQPSIEIDENVPEYEAGSKSDTGSSDVDVEDFHSILMDPASEPDVQDKQVRLVVAQELAVTPEPDTHNERFRYCTFSPLTG